MKIPKVKVTINFGEHKDRTGLIVAFDRDKWYQVQFEDGSTEWFKGFYLDGISKLSPKSRYLLPYDIKGPLSHKQLMEDRKYYVNRGRGTNNRFRYFEIWIRDLNISHCFLTFNQLKSSVRYCLQNNYSFNIIIETNTRNSSTTHLLLDYDYESLILPKESKSDDKKYRSFRKSIFNIIESFS